MDQDRLEELLRLARRSDPSAVAALVDLYGRRIYGLVFRLTGSRDAADDLLQETFLRMIRTLPDYQENGRFEAWLFRIAANLARDHVRRGRRRGVTASLDADEEATTPAAESSIEARAGPEGQAVGAEAEERLLRCIDRLPALDREMILLRHYSELPFKQIAEILQIPLGTALARAHRALERLRTELSNEMER